MKTFNQFLEEAVKPGFYGSAKTDKATMEVIKEFQTKFKKLGWKSERQQHMATTSYVFTDPTDKTRYVDLTVWLNNKKYGCNGACVLSAFDTGGSNHVAPADWRIGDDKEQTEEAQLKVSAQALKWIKAFKE